MSSYRPVGRKRRAVGRVFGVDGMHIAPNQASENVELPYFQHRYYKQQVLTGDFTILSYGTNRCDKTVAGGWGHESECFLLGIPLMIIPYQLQDKFFDGGLAASGSNPSAIAWEILPPGMVNMCDKYNWCKVKKVTYHIDLMFPRFHYSPSGLLESNPQCRIWSRVFDGSPWESADVNFDQPELLTPSEWHSFVHSGDAVFRGVMPALPSMVGEIHSTFHTIGNAVPFASKRITFTIDNPNKHAADHWQTGSSGTMSSADPETTGVDEYGWISTQRASLTYANGLYKVPWLAIMMETSHSDECYTSGVHQTSNPTQDAAPYCTGVDVELDMVFREPHTHQNVTAIGDDIDA